MRAPDGRQWRIGRRWLPRRPRLGRVDVPDVGDFGPLDLLGGHDLGIFGAIALAIVAVVVTVVLALVLFNVIAIALELTIVLALLVWGILARVVFRRPWEVVARSDAATFSWPVVGWRRSRRMIRDVAEDLRSGTHPAEAARHVGAPPPEGV